MEDIVLVILCIIILVAITIFCCITETEGVVKFKSRNSTEQISMHCSNNYIAQNLMVNSCPPKVTYY